MKITIIHAHWNNRGDEAAIRALVDELKIKYPQIIINVYILSPNAKQFPYEDSDIRLCNVLYPKRKNIVDYWLTWLTKGKMSLLSNSKEFIQIVKDSDLVLHAPGGPSIGDIYYNDEKKYLQRLDLIRRMGIKYAFYAPSMGPFRRTDKRRNALRKKVLNGAEFIYLREGQSADYVKGFGIDEKKIKVSLDSAFQHYGNEAKYEKQYNEYEELNSFIKSYDRVVGMTITNLNWHPIHSKNEKLAEMIFTTFTDVIEYFKTKNIGVLFIPQLFGRYHDYQLMQSYAKSNCFVMDDLHDCYFQQHIIEKLYAVIGMRYHSNIFSAKMGTPFISIAYEQKMSGFMTLSGLRDYCIDINDLSAKLLIDKYEKLEANYSEFKSILVQKKEEWVKKSHLTTEKVFDLLDRGEK